MPDSYDIVIVGGGMVGATLARALADTGQRIAVLESGLTEVADDDVFDLRVSALTRASQRIFESLSVWADMVAVRVAPFREMQVWDEGGHGSINFDSAEIGLDTLGHIVENRVIQSALLRSLGQFDHVDVIRAEVEIAQADRAAARVRLRDGTELCARLLVGADGARSAVRTQAGVAVRGWAYDQTALVATVKPERDHLDVARQRFLRTGPLAFLPLPDGYCSIVWSTGPDHAQRLLKLNEREFSQELEQAFQSTLGGVQVCGRRAAFPLRLQHAQRYVGSRMALIGDAAHTIHPLAGQGVNLGLLDAAVLYEVIADALARQRDPGDFAVLRRYERWRKGDNVAVMAVMDGFKRLFGSELSVLSLARNLGLSLVDRAVPVKQLIMRRAMGLSGDLPALARSPSTVF